MNCGIDRAVAGVLKAPEGTGPSLVRWVRGGTRTRRAKALRVRAYADRLGQRAMRRRVHTVVMDAVRAPNQLRMLLPKTETTPIMRMATRATSNPYSVTAIASSAARKSERAARTRL